MTIILTSEELADVTGYRTPKRQLEDLHRQGFYRARIGCPARAGIGLTVCRSGGAWLRLPRASGDRPLNTAQGVSSLTVAPRERG